MIIHHIDDTFHAEAVDILHQCLKILHCAVLRIHRPVVGNGVGAAQCAFACFLTDGMDGHKPDDINAQGFYPLQIAPQRLKGALLGMIADVDAVHYLIAVGFRCIQCHG